MQDEDRRSTIADWQRDIERQLEPLLGSFTARMAVKTAALRALKKPPEELTSSEIPALLEGLRPMLNTLIGSVHTQVILKSLKEAVEKR